MSWIVAPYIICEHPAAPPGYGEAFVSGLLSALAANSKVWAKTAFILNYDENDGFFDHVPPPVPPGQPGTGKSTVDLTGEDYHGVPVGLGPRVPLLIVSPWTRGGFVNSQLSDHTSVIRFLEKRFGVVEPNITPWRRAVCGDLTSMFDFARPDAAWSELPPASPATVDQSCTLAHPALPATQAMPSQEAGQRPARPLPYEIDAWTRTDDNGLNLHIDNRGAAGVVLAVHADGGGSGPWDYTLEAGTSLDDAIPVGGERYALTLYGPNGYLRRFAGSRTGAARNLEVRLRYEPIAGSLVATVTNKGDQSLTLAINANNYLSAERRRLVLAPTMMHEMAWPIAQTAHWYDLTATVAEDSDYENRFAGHVETDAASLSDPALGRHPSIFSRS